MKVCRRAGTFLFGLGCASAFSGVLSLIVKTTGNPQLQLVLQSFYTVSDQAAVRLFNTGVVFCLTHPWGILAVGGAAMLLGGILLAVTSVRETSASSKESYRKAAPPPVSSSFKPFVPPQENPFAVASADERTPSAPVCTFAPAIQQTKHSETNAAYLFKPLLEQNRIESTETASPFARPETYAENVSLSHQNTTDQKRRSRRQTSRT